METGLSDSQTLLTAADLGLWSGVRSEVRFSLILPVLIIVCDAPSKQITIITIPISIWIPIPPVPECD